MKRNPEYRAIALRLLSLALATSFSLPALAGPVGLVSQPISATTASVVKPNVLFILDDSQSMDGSSLPDWATSSTPNLIDNAAYNGIYYNPAITYTPPVLYDSFGVLDPNTYPNQTGQATATGASAAAKPNWKQVKDNAFSSTSGTSILDGSASFYTIVPGEYCKAQDLKVCNAQSAPDTTYSYPAPLRWCTTNGDAIGATPVAGHCQGLWVGGYTTASNARYPKPPTATITITGTVSTSVSGITIGAAGPQILSAPTGATTTNTTLASSIADAINKCAAAATGACTTDGYSATVSGNIVTIIAKSTGTFVAPVVTRVPALPASGMTIAVSGNFAGGNAVPGSNRFINIISTNDSYPYPGTTSKASTRSDCSGTTCTYVQEMTNYANWWTYYHTRLQAMKTSVSRAFKTLDNRFRVGFTTISDTGAKNNTNTTFTNPTFLGVDTFETAHKNRWFKKLFAAKVVNATPLRGALSKAGRYYAHKFTAGTDAPDPVQYSCQQNFTILSTDGYWNDMDETSTYGPFDLTGAVTANGTSVGNRDSAALLTARPMLEGTKPESETLADVAKYYYETDLRTGTFGSTVTGTLNNCTGALGVDVCTNNVYTSLTDNNEKQHMTTFTMGLGADGTLNFTSDYETAGVGNDFYNLKNNINATNWPDPILNTKAERIDDLWHAAVNGRGQYFSAKDPDQIVAGFSKALSSITAKLGSAAAAATSTLNPVSGNNFAYVASYTTVLWTGNLEARKINTDSGLVSDTASWCVENIPADTCAAPGTKVPDNSGSSTIYNCVVTPTTAGACDGTFDSGTSTCTTQIANACTGTLPGRVSANSDTRIIKTANSAGNSLVDFLYPNLNAADFSAAHIAGLNGLTGAQLTLASGAHLVDYLRGQNGYEDRAANTNKFFRARNAVLGDALESEPAYIAHATFSYSYPGYAAFKNDQILRPGTVYMGTNDGMMHAFDAVNGVERWAYVPSMVIPNMWKLANASYPTNHVNYVNGSAIISDFKCSNCGAGGTAAWRTILVAGLNAGGRGYYALDITDPVNPKLLWEFTANKANPNGDPNLGFTFGRPVVTQKTDGTWVVLATSGYDNGTNQPVAPNTDPFTYVANSPGGDGRGHLYVIDASTGALTTGGNILTTEGTPADPSGLGQIGVWNKAAAGNEAGDVYGGDLKGNVWRFDINAGTATQFATLTSDGTTRQPITTTPILAEVTTTTNASKHVVYIATGKYLEKGDISNLQVQSLYGIKDDGTAVGDPRSHTGSVDKMVPQTITQTGNSRQEQATTLPNVNFDSDRGWYVDFPDHDTGSERANIDMQLVLGTLIVPTIVPSTTACSPGGYSWLNFFNYANGWPVRDTTLAGATNINVSVKYDATIVGVNVIYIKGKAVVETVTSVNPTPDIAQTPPLPMGKSTFGKKRSMWRELIQ